MVFRSSRPWCYICRDEKPDVACSAQHCKKSFHFYCLQHTGYDKPLDGCLDDFLCESCQEEDTESICYVCKSCGTDDLVSVVYDGSPKHAHADCLKQESLGNSERDTQSSCEKTQETIRTTFVNAIGGKPKLGNVDICYVCQKGGKLLCCDLCDQSYHPKCIDSDFLDPIIFDKDGKWGCPICYGKDPLKNMCHKRLTKKERQNKAEQWQKCIARESRRCRVNRSQFLCSCWSALKPFVPPDIYQKLKKEAPNFSKSNQLKVDDLSIILPKNEDSAIKQSVLYRDEALWKLVEEKAKVSGYELLRQGVELKPYQIWGVNWLLEAFYQKAGAILADEMGLGKTIQSLAFLSALKASSISGPHLIVVPLSTVGNWIREVHLFTPSLTVTKVCGSRLEREHSMMDELASIGIYDLFVTTYETVVTEEWFFTDRFQWQCVILDEAHRIKNDNARMRHSLDRVKCNMRVLLTGTPLQNNIKELFTLLNFLFPEVIKQNKLVDTLFTASKKKTNLSTGSTPCSVMANPTTMMDPCVLDKEKVNALTLLLSKLMLRRTKDLVVKLPDKIEYDIWLPLSPSAGLWYQRLLELTASATEDTTSLRKLLGAVVKIRICCCHPRGLVSRDTQLENFIQTFRDTGWSDEEVNLIKEDAKQLKQESCGLQHIQCSSKLVFLDKFLTQLHSENMEFCHNYREEFLKAQENRRHLEISRRHTVLTSLMNGRVIPNVTAESVQKEIDILTVPETCDGGGLRDLHAYQYGITTSEPKKDHFMVKYMYDTENRDKSSEEPRPHKVLVFTQFQLVLDELSAYCTWRGWRFMRLDGSTNKMIRELDTREFNSPDSNHFVYLISTRAGGLGINLVTANHVVMFDEDWNPFVDLQAVDRAHRIGQTRHVHVWRLMTEWTIEERMALRRQQKLLLNKMLIQANVEALECQDDTATHDKLSSEEVRRLLQYGRTALLEATFDHEIERSSLEDILKRKRRDLKGLEDEKLKHADLEETCETESVSFHEGLWNEEIDESGKDLCSKSAKESSTPGDPEPLNKELGEQQETNDFSLYHRPQRLRRQPPLTYNPMIRLVKVHVDRKMIRERRCFQCGHGGLPVGSKPSEKNKATPLVGCMRCPKVYHLKTCLQLNDMPPKSWMCPWHECCLCYRRAGSCGGLLIHCVECPTAFCFDCFPPEYRRYEPGPAFFENLQKRGWNVTPQKFVTFLCSKCKALKEQERRRHLSKQQLEDEMRTRKSQDDSARLDAKKEHVKQGKSLAKEERLKQATAKKQFFEQKKKLDAYDKQLQNDLRAAVDQLYPPRYIEILCLRKSRFLEMHQHTSERTQEVAGEEKLEEKRDHSMKLRPCTSNRLKCFQKRRFILPDRFKLPGEILRLCDNCHLPLHDASQCPFPLEVCRSSVVFNPMVKVELTENTTECIESASKAEHVNNSGTEELNETKSHSREVTLQCVETPLLTENETLAEQTETTVDTHGTLEERTETTADTHGTLEERTETTADTPGTSEERTETTADTHGTLAERTKTTVDTNGTLTERAETTAGTNGTLAEQIETTVDTNGTLAEQIETTMDTNGTLAEQIETTVDMEETLSEPMETTSVVIQTMSDVDETPSECVRTKSDEDETLPELMRKKTETLDTALKLMETKLGTSETLLEPMKMKSETWETKQKFEPCPKLKCRTVCSLCQSITKLHSRKHCSLLSDTEKQEYEERRKQYHDFVVSVQKKSSEEKDRLCIPSNFESFFTETYDLYSIADKIFDGTRRQLECELHKKLGECLTLAGLEKCIVVQEPACSPKVCSKDSTKDTDRAARRKHVKVRQEVKTPKMEEEQKGAVKKNVIKKRHDTSVCCEKPKKQKTQEEEKKPCAIIPSSCLTKIFEKKQNTVEEQMKASASCSLKPNIKETYQMAPGYKNIIVPNRTHDIKEPVKTLGVNGTNHSKKNHVSQTCGTSRVGVRGPTPVPYMGQQHTAKVSCRSDTIAYPKHTGLPHRAPSQHTLRDLFNAFNAQNASSNVRHLSHSLNIPMASGPCYATHPTSPNDMMVAAAFLFNAQQHSSDVLSMHPHPLLNHPCMPNTSPFWTPMPQPILSPMDPNFPSSALQFSSSVPTTLVESMSQKPPACDTSNETDSMS
ncbi:uncharacterized protein LOC128883655 isoform X2 [Hylaeus volcanicus]|uniref:uncharacterized protein LOC128883655 isoform X2 n=1 Tax=Hylaeus volcanicus TaxID=313075 RepID=UPI0023B78051|nr:uncharacterized protein LOC128883655 isoform X2 [Hylaeus volcanicus]